MLLIPSSGQPASQAANLQKQLGNGRAFQMLRDQTLPAPIHFAPENPNFDQLGALHGGIIDRPEDLL